MRITELEIGKAVVRFLVDQRFEVYEEVQAHRSGRIADCVAQWMRKGIIDTVVWGPPVAGRLPNGQRRGRGLWLAGSQAACSAASKMEIP